jgi:hypothetical protein
MTGLHEQQRPDWPAAFGEGTVSGWVVAGRGMLGNPLDEAAHRDG